LGLPAGLMSREANPMVEVRENENSEPPALQRFAMLRQ
jgi:hypothetical protein